MFNHILQKILSYEYRQWRDFVIFDKSSITDTQDVYHTQTILNHK